MISDFTYPSTPHADTPRPNGTDEIIAQQRVTDLLETAFAEGSPAGKAVLKSVMLSIGTNQGISP